MAVNLLKRVAVVAVLNVLAMGRLGTGSLSVKRLHEKKHCLLILMVVRKTKLSSQVIQYTIRTQKTKFLFKKQ